HLVGRTNVLIGINGEWSIHVLPGKAGEDRRPVRRTYGCVDRGEVLCERGEPKRVDRLLVEARRVVVADLLFYGRAGVAVLRRALQNLARPGFVAVDHFVVAADPRLVGGNRMARQPRAAGVGVKVAARIGGTVDSREVEAERIRRQRCW